MSVFITYPPGMTIDITSDHMESKQIKRPNIVLFFFPVVPKKEGDSGTSYNMDEP